MYTGLFLETSFKMNKILLGVSLFSGLILINQGCFAATEKADQPSITYSYDSNNDINNIDLQKQKCNKSKTGIGFDEEGTFYDGEGGYFTKDGIYFLEPGVFLDHSGIFHTNKGCLKNNEICDEKGNMVFDRESNTYNLKILKKYLTSEELQNFDSKFIESKNRVKWYDEYYCRYYYPNDFNTKDFDTRSKRPDVDNWYNNTAIFEAFVDPLIYSLLSQKSIYCDRMYKALHSRIEYTNKQN